MKITQLDRAVALVRSLESVDADIQNISAHGLRCLFTEGPLHLSGLAQLSQDTKSAMKELALSGLRSRRKEIIEQFASLGIEIDEATAAKE